MNKIISEIKFLFIGTIFWIYIWLVAITSKIRIINKENSDSMRNSGANLIFAFWHNRQFFLCFPERYSNVSILISKSKDGEFISRAINFFGIKTIRGSSSKGGIKALIEMHKTLKAGQVIGLTPDGPRGPVYKVQPGIVHLAQKSNLPIIPVSFSAKRKKIFNSWDKYQIPYPFNEIIVIYGSPLTIHEDDTMEMASIKIKTALDLNMENGEKLIS